MKSNECYREDPRVTGEPSANPARRSVRAAA